MVVVILMALNIVFLTADNNIIGGVLVEVEREFGVDSGQIGLVSLFFSIVGAAFPIVYSMLGDLFDRRRRTLASAIVTMCWSLGGIIGVLVAGYSIGAGLGWRAPFLIVSLPNALLVPHFLLVAPAPRVGAREEAVGELVAQGILYPRTVRLRDYLSLARVRTNVLLFLQGIVGSLPWGATFLLVKYMQEEKGFTVGVAMTIYAVFGIGGVLGTIGGGVLGGRLFARRPRLQPALAGVATLAGAVATLAILYLVPAEPLPVAIAGLLGAGLASVTSSNMRNMLLAVNAPEQRGPIFAVFNLTDAVGFGVGQYVAGTLAVAVGTTAALGISFAFWIPCGLILLVAIRAFEPDLARLDAVMRTVAESMRATSPAE